MDNGLDDILEQCLTRIGAGASVEDCLADYPQQRSALEAPLMSAAAIARLPRPPMPASTRALLEARMLAQAAQRRAAQPSAPPKPSASWRTLGPDAMLAGFLRAWGYRGPLAQPWLRLASAAIVLVLALALGAGALAAARALVNALAPARPTPAPTAPAERPFTLDGQVQQIAQEAWVVAGTPFALDARTVITGAPTIGASASVRGVVLADGRMLAYDIIVVNAPLAPTSAPSTPSPAPTVAPTPTIAPPPTIAPTAVPPPAPPSDSSGSNEGESGENERKCKEKEHGKDDKKCDKERHEKDDKDENDDKEDDHDD